MRMGRGYRLVINADDLGYSDERDLGIIECFQKSAITSASLMVNGVNAIKAADRAKTVNLPLGLHLNLTEGLPVGSQSYTTIVNKDGAFWGKFGLREELKAGRVNISEVRNEIENQIERFQQLLGYLPYHVDGHQHIHVYPEICQVFAKLLQNKGIRVTRLSRESCLDGCDWIDSDRLAFYKEVIYQSNLCKEIFEKHKISFAPLFAGLSTSGADMTVDRLRSALITAFTSNIGPGYPTAVIKDTETSQPVRICELMVHPGYPTGNSGGCGTGPDEFSKSDHRKHEMDMLLSLEFRKYLDDNEITLCSFQEAFESHIL